MEAVRDQKLLCLIVDDDPDACWALEHVLKKLQLATRRALNAEQALAELRESSCALALLDAKLPDLDGLELARRMRAVAPEIFIILVSGYFYRYDPAIQDGQASGLIQDFVGKPFRHEEIIAAVGRALGERGQGN